ncbi:MAG: hypothetical protein A2X67_14255 [Ignavibacteria bacterium GWA2_55_11]|nr:MAG: hypothetical protein A2X67_14255 [Ignavibacteria bacterium GWA2_55_11]OGU47144.1 MAG: hypothetical protein A2X68_12745 [Ignavibacteria bacterium GWC2_56_12]OGU65129.1 MAG: hypothetical protein A3C56_11460 [Ignavibacteria bacterium RIFCSPHIGHO2_02_FULL_56_12]OGU75970.1 MAG: hypothetical protein A3G43_11380 [Ignavibacteria bacterium RIFCSPLOWO2_12_FULL_56_21]HAV21976.1 DUF192 domain-containing protein [Bacteroidota bacterium]
MRFPTSSLNLKTACAYVACLALLGGCDAKPRQQDRPVDTMFVKEGELTFRRQDGTTITKIDIEIADDQEQRTSGLMGRPMLDERCGMLFVFEQEEPRSFWMMNTMISLDMMFVNGKKEVVTVHSRTIPFSTESYASSADCQYVVEVNAGFADRYGISQGDKIDWEKK